MIKRRVRQKLEVMAKEDAAGGQPTDAELSVYLATHAARFTPSRPTSTYHGGPRADEFRPAYLQLTQLDATTFDVRATSSGKPGRRVSDPSEGSTGSLANQRLPPGDTLVVGADEIDEPIANVSAIELRAEESEQAFDV